MEQKLLKFLFVFMLLSNVSYGQQRSISGRVTNESGSPLAGVTVRTDGADQATQTDQDGRYAIRVGATVRNLIFFYLGYETKQITVDNQSSINVQLNPDDSRLDEVVVTGYGETTSKRTTGSVVTIKAAELEMSPYSSPDRALQGMAAGVQSTGGSGQPGALQNVRIRGVGSFGDTNPLYVVNGVPINAGDLTNATTTANALAGLNPNDIETLTVLKDAAATAIYGSRGANGVVVITTKSGVQGRTRISLDAEVGIANRAYTPSVRPLTTEENIEIIGASLLNSPQYVDTYGLTPDNISDMVVDLFGIDRSINTDWEDIISRTGFQQQYNLAFDGGNEKTTFHIGGGYFDQEGAVIGTELKRYSGNVNINHNVSSKIKVGTNILLSQTNQLGASNSGYFANPVLTSLFALPYYSPYNADGSVNIVDLNGGLFNPLATTNGEYSFNNADLQKAVISVYGEYQIIPNLTFKTQYGIDYNGMEEQSYDSPFYGDGISVGGQAYSYYTRYFNWNWTNTLNYRWEIDESKDWVANFLLGYEAQKSQYLFTGGGVNGLPYNTALTVLDVGATPVGAYGARSDYAFASTFLSGDVSYQNKYVLSGSFRRDGSSRFGPENRYGNFWSVGGTWNVDQEDFIKESEWINLLKLRSSYGVIGNANIDNYDWSTLYTFGFNYNGILGAIPDQYGDPTLTWEQTSQFNIGLDFALFNNRLGGTIEYYNRSSDQLLYDAPLAYTTGFEEYTSNFASVANRGWEFSLRGTVVQTEDFRWDLNANFTYNHNEITYVNDDGTISSPYITQIGQPIDAYYLPLWAGVDPANGDPLWYTDGSRTATTNTYGEAERALTGSSPIAPIYGGFGTNLQYKGIGLDVLFSYNFGNDIYVGYASYTGYNAGAYYGSYNQNTAELDYWTPENTDATAPKPVFGSGNLSASSASDRLLFSGDYVRLRNVALSYNLPSRLFENNKVFRSLRVYARGSNLWTWVRDKDLAFDPEAFDSSVGSGSTGTTNLDSYIPRTITFGVNVGF